MVFTCASQLKSLDTVTPSSLNVSTHSITPDSTKLKTHSASIKIFVKRPNDLDWNGIELPVFLAFISKFEKQNETISVNVLGFEESVIHQLRISDYNHQNEVNLLLIAQLKKSALLCD